MNDHIEQTEQSVLHTYNRFPIVLESGQGVYLKDTDGKTYLDFGAGIAVSGLGYHYPGFDEALKEQIGKLLHTSNLYYNVPLADAAGKLTKASGMSRVFFTNSGTEAVEGALKAARKYAYTKKKTDCYEIVSMNHSFHGRSAGALSVTGNPHYQEAFRPLMGGVRFADFNDLESVKAQVNEHTCAILAEPVQGEGGVHPAKAEFLQGLRALCDERDILLIFDEIQCGMGRCGPLFAWQHYGVQPDILTSAKALGCGVPVGAFLLNEKAASASLTPGDHGTTYGGNPFAMAAVSKVLDIFEKDKIVEHVKEITPYLEERLEAMVRKYSCLLERRGLGLLQGLVVGNGVKAGDVAARALKAGLIVLTAGNDVLRIVPPLIIERRHVDEMEEKLQAALN